MLEKYYKAKNFIQNKIAVYTASLTEKKERITLDEAIKIMEGLENRPTLKYSFESTIYTSCHTDNTFTPINVIAEELIPHKTNNKEYLSDPESKIVTYKIRKIGMYEKKHTLELAYWSDPTYRQVIEFNPLFSRDEKIEAGTVIPKKAIQKINEICEASKFVHEYSASDKSKNTLQTMLPYLNLESAIKQFSIDLDRMLSKYHADRINPYSGGLSDQEHKIELYKAVIAILDAAKDGTINTVDQKPEVKQLLQKKELTNLVRDKKSLNWCMGNSLGQTLTTLDSQSYSAMVGFAKMLKSKGAGILEYFNSVDALISKKIPLQTLYDVVNDYIDSKFDVKNLFSCVYNIGSIAENSTNEKDFLARYDVIKKTLVKFIDLGGDELGFYFSNEAYTDSIFDDLSEEADLAKMKKLSQSIIGSIEKQQKLFQEKKFEFSMRKFNSENQDG